MNIEIKDYKKKYLTYLKEMGIDNISTPSVSDILAIPDFEKRLKKWQNAKIKVKSIPNFKKLVHPFYIGYGNHKKSDILFIGKELGFNLGSHPDLLFHESISNLCQWQAILKNEKVDFDPRWPTSYFKKLKSNSGHTWRLYSKIIAAYLGETDLKTVGKRMFLETKIKENSFFDHCFTTEFNHAPSAKSEGKVSNQIRKDFLKSDFFTAFKVIVFTAAAYLKDETELQELFSCERSKDEDLIKEGSKNDKNRVRVFRNKERKQLILLTSQLSGSAGWGDTQMMQIGKLIRKHIDDTK